MEHLVQGHIYGNYYISDQDPKIIEETCEECGDCDWIILSYEKGYKYEALAKYFKGIRNTKQNIRDYYTAGISNEEILDYLIDEYDNEKNMIKILEEDNILTKEEKKKLLRIVYYYKKRQLELFKSIQPEETTKVKEKPKKMVYKNNI